MLVRFGTEVTRQRRCGWGLWHGKDGWEGCYSASHDGRGGTESVCVCVGVGVGVGVCVRVRVRVRVRASGREEWIWRGG